jgi:ribosomal protein S12 methylthiotransferase accessory factor
VDTVPPATSIYRPVFKEKFHLEAVPGEGFFLLAENESHVLEGSELERVVPCIDGRRSVDEIARLVSPDLSAQSVQNVVAFLAQQGHIREADPLMPPHLAAFWNELGVVDTRRLPDFLAQHPVNVINLSADGHPGLETALHAFGLHTSPSGGVLIVAVDDYLDPRLEAINRMCLENRTPWLLFKPDGVNIWIGPLFVPHQGPCWSCVASRLRDNREVERHVLSRTQSAGPLPTTRARLWTSRQQAYAMAVTQFVRWLVTGTNPVLQSYITIAETVSFAFSNHPIVRRPQCERCGAPLAEHNGSEPFQFRERHISRVQDGGERFEGPEVTFERYRHHISPVTGVVRDLVPSPWHNVTPLRTYVAGHNFAFKSESLYFLKAGLRNLSSGKGRTDAQARTSALCEALERYSGVYRGEEPRRRATFSELGDEAVHPNRCMLFSETQYREREHWLSRGSQFQMVPQPFDDQATLEWSPVYSSTEKRTKYLPTSYLYYGYPYAADAFYAWADSNGNAAGTTCEDACLQAFYELVERDAVCIWWYNQVRRPRVDLASFGDPYLAELEAFYAAAGREFWVLDLTTDLNIPSFVAVNRRLNGPTEDIIMGFGAHMDARIGVSRALTEMNQFMPAVLNVAPDGATQYGTNDRDTLHWWQTATKVNQPYLSPLTEPHTRRLADYPALPDGDMLDQLLACFAIVEERGMEVLLLDQTRPDIGLTVVKVIVPGLRHFWARLAPGRLYDVPVALGWLKQPTPESELNPIAMFL